MIRTQKAMLALLDHIGDSIPGVRLGNEPADPYLWLPAPPGYALWVMLQGRDYIAVISRREPPQQIRHQPVGRWGDEPRWVWKRASDYFNQDAELAAALRAGREEAVPQPTPPPTPQERLSPPPEAPAPIEDQEADDSEEEAAAPDDPAGYDSHNIVFRPIRSTNLVSLQVDISKEAAEYVESVVASGILTKRQIVEAGVLMYLAHIYGRIGLLGPEGTRYVRRMAAGIEEGFDPDAMLAMIMTLAETNQVGETVVGTVTVGRRPPSDG